MACNIDKTLATGKDKIPYVYSLSLDELTKLCKDGKTDMAQALVKAYSYGFIKGARAKGRNRVPQL